MHLALYTNKNWRTYLRKVQIKLCVKSVKDSSQQRAYTSVSVSLISIKGS